MIEESPVDWWLWRPVIRQVASLNEILEHWDLDRLLDCHQAMNLDARLKEAIQDHHKDD